jgi:periplasmic protein CpxP/Spy
MKKVIAVLVLFVGLNTMAQKRENRDLNPEQIATLTTKKMTLDLDLNESQQSKIYELQLENAKSRMTKMEAHKKAKENSESMKKLSSEERFAKKTEMLDHQIAQKKKMKAILNADQFEKWEKMNHNRKNRLHKKRGERKHNMKKENKE